MRKQRWPLCKLDELCEISMGKTPSRSTSIYWGDGYPWLSIADMSNTKEVESTKETITKEGAALFKGRIVPQNTVVFSFKLSIGKVGITKVPMFTNEAIAAFQIRNESLLDTGYLYRALSVVDYSGRTDRAVMGQTLNKQKLKMLTIPLPPLDEQRRIAAILDKADAVRRKRKEAIALTEDLLRSAFLEMFGDPVTNPKGWRVQDLDSHLSFVTSGSRGWAKYYAESGDRFIRSLDVRMNYISDTESAYVNAPSGSEASRARVESGDVLLTITGSRIGRVAPVPKNYGVGYISQHVAILRTEHTILPQYLSFFLSLPSGGQRQIARMQYGQTKPGLNLSQIRRFQIPLPAVRHQKKFEEFWQGHQSTVARQRMLSDEGDGLFNSLLQRAFQGDL